MHKIVSMTYHMHTLNIIIILIRILLLQIYCLDTQLVLNCIKLLRIMLSMNKFGMEVCSDGTAVMMGQHSE